ncbi:hypothetical protein DdX_00585 [Ditylenchus destructor]|uniref:Uncharacterized protein n=1 Tax=Ditylenchus destructor TaxID=166010 RepID=A0AAD4RD19_9BILA|nr:hypothetical protein DdX_00585 [Ditylenchus destructor]
MLCYFILDAAWFLPVSVSIGTALFLARASLGWVRLPAYVTKKAAGRLFLFARRVARKGKGLKSGSPTINTLPSVRFYPPALTHQDGKRLFN